MGSGTSNAIDDVMTFSPAMLALLVKFDAKAIRIVEQCLGEMSSFVCVP